MNFMPLPLRCLSIVGLSLALTACDTPPTVVDQHFGLAVQRAQAQQSLLAPGVPQPMMRRCPSEQPAPNCPMQHQHPRNSMGHGMGQGADPHSAHSAHMAQGRQRTKPDTDGASALAAVTRYQQSFQAPPAAVPIFNIGLGAVSAP